MGLHFETKDDHLAAFNLKVAELLTIVKDYRTEETGYARYQRDLNACLQDLKDLSNLSLSDPEPDDFAISLLNATSL